MVYNLSRIYVSLLAYSERLRMLDAQLCSLSINKGI